MDRLIASYPGVGNKSQNPRDLGDFRDWDWDLGFILKIWDLGFNSIILLLIWLLFKKWCWTPTTDLKTNLEHTGTCETPVEAFAETDSIFGNTPQKPGHQKFGTLFWTFQICNYYFEVPLCSRINYLRQTHLQSIDRCIDNPCVETFSTAFWKGNTRTNSRDSGILCGSILVIWAFDPSHFV